MDRIIYLFDILLVFLYLVLFVLYLRNLFSSHRPLGRLFMAGLPVILTVHFIKLILQGLSVNHCPTAGLGQSLSFAAFSLGFIYFIVERYQRYFATGTIFIGIVLIFQSASLFMFKPAGEPGAALSNIPYGFHAPIALLALSAFATSAIYGAIYLTEMMLLKLKRFGTGLKNMPPLETVERMQGIASVIGVVLMGISLIAGITLAIIYKPSFAIYDPKIMIAVIIFAIFVYGVLGSHFFSFSGRKKSAIALIGFSAALISITVVRFCLPTFHRF